MQRTGWGKSAVYFVATALLRAARRGAHGHRLPAPRADAQPDRRRRPRGRARGDGELGEHRRLGRHVRRDRRGRGRRPAGEPGAAEQPRLPGPGAPPAHGEHGPAGGGRGALRLRLGARLPARLPAAARADRRAAAGDPGAGHHGDGERPGGPGRHRAAGRSTGEPLVLRGSLDRESLRLSRGAAADACAAAGLARRAPGGAAGGGHRLHAHDRRRGGGRGVPARARGPRRRPTPARPIRSSGWPRRRTCWRTGSRRWSPPARSGWVSTSRTSGSSCTSARRRRPWRTTSRSGAPAGRSNGPRWCCCPERRTATSGRTSPRSRSRRSRSCAGRWTCCRSARCRRRRSRPGWTCRGRAWRCC